VFYEDVPGHGFLREAPPIPVGASVKFSRLDGHIGSPLSVAFDHLGGFCPSTLSLS